MLREGTQRGSSTPPGIDGGDGCESGMRRAARRDARATEGMESCDGLGGLCRALLHAALALADASSEAEVRELVIEIGASTMPIREISLWGVVDDHLVLTAARGDGPHAPLATGGAWPLDCSAPVAVAARTGEVQWTHSSSEASAAGLTEEGAFAPASSGRVPFDSVCLPLSVGGARAGVVTLTLDCRRDFTDEERALLALFAAQCASAMERSRARRAELRARVRMRRIQAIATAFARAATAGEVTEVACRIGTAALGARSCAIWIARPDGILQLNDVRGISPLLIDPFRELPSSALGPVLAHGGLWIETERDFEREAPALFETAKALGIVSAWCAVPLTLDGRIAGLASFGHPLGHRFDDDERSFCHALAQLCAQALDRVRLLAKAQEAAWRAEEANRVKDEFLATVSHELRTPLNAINGWSCILSQRIGDPIAVAKAVEVIRRNVHAQSKIVEDILDVSRIITGKLKIDAKPVDMLAIVKDALDVIRPSAEAKRITMTLVDPDREPCLLLGDAQRLQQVAWNLLSNAVKFTDPGGHVTLCVEQMGAEVVLAVADTGRGIDKEFLPYVFERFKQADSSTTRKFGGLGLGLAIVRHIVELHGGWTSAYSPGPGCGATFRVAVPAGAVP